MATNYKKSMNLPKTDFPMRANLSQREPAWIQMWDEKRIHEKAVARRAECPSFILHDGPPYANGHIHMGTAFNKIIKDIIVKYKTMRGFYSPYVPGWDTHGQPIEHQVEKNLGPERMAEISRAKLRMKCRDYALKFVDIQRGEFKRLGVLGDWDNPYLTLNHEYEAGNVEVFKKMYLDGSVYRGRKAVHWCTTCKTALAEAEIEYAADTSTSIYVAYELNGPTPWDAQANGVPVSILIWTTTAWTLPANGFVTLNPEAAYVAVKVESRVLVVAEELLPKLVEELGWTDYEVLSETRTGTELSELTYKHPVHESRRENRIITDQYVDMSTGTGAVHGAGGHGAEDNLLAVKYDLPIYMPVDDEGFFDEGGGPFEGNKVRRDDHLIIDWLAERGTLVGSKKITHSYPHCWRCKNPVIFRATEQWFVSMDGTGLRKAAIDNFDSFTWIPAWTRNRMGAMISDRPDWCISRQRSWGVPIPVHHCKECGEIVATAETFDAIIELFSIEGADAWYTKDPTEYLPAGTVCKHCGCSELVPESDIVDVWWESGVSHISVLEKRPELHRPAELYLEGSDQHRGWFQSSYLTSMGYDGTAPFKNLLTCGFVVDGDGRKMSKSVGNVISPIDIMNKLGADIIRLWVGTTDYSQDMTVSDEILARSSDTYRRLRNTFRFLLSNLDDFNAEDVVALNRLEELDRAELVRLADVLEEVTRHNDEWHFYSAQRAIADYAGELSSTYLDVLKDRLYAEAPNSPARRSAQTAISVLLSTLVRALAPVLAFTCDETWSFIPAWMTQGVESIHLTDWPVVDLTGVDVAAVRAKFAVLRTVRDAVTKALEDARNEKLVNKSQEAAIVVTCAPEVAHILEMSEPSMLEELFIVSHVEVKSDPSTEEIGVKVIAAQGEKCPRCWNYRPLGQVEGHSDVCTRCAHVLDEIGFSDSAGE
ncbi:MAG: isoleucine--tRNA ligase [Coriobacteriia bacterium]|nr:isoleucine--tRNA ligase [Coriobacteriia bacterium]